MFSLFTNVLETDHPVAEMNIRPSSKNQAHPAAANDNALTPESALHKPCKSTLFHIVKHKTHVASQVTQCDIY